MFQAYVAVTNSKHVKLVDANPYIIAADDNGIYLKEIDKEDANGLVFYLLSELDPKEVYLFRESLTVIGVNGIINTRTDSKRM